MASSPERVPSEKSVEAEAEANSRVPRCELCKQRKVSQSSRPLRPSRPFTTLDAYGPVID